MRRIFLPLLLLGVASPAAAQRSVDWDTRFLFYSDNSEFFNPYREGATWMGARLWTELALQATPKVQVRVGLSADHLSGDSSFADVQPLLSLRYHHEHSTGVLGTLIVEDRHGLLEPFMVLQRDILKPVEYGSQWIERRDRWAAEYYLNWRALNTPTQREHFDMGLVTHVDALPWLRVGMQGLWVHRGGQLFAAGQSTSNNMVAGLGLIAHDTLGPLGAASLEGWYLGSSPGWPDSLPSGVDAKGHGTLIRATVTPFTHVRFTGVLWHGNGFSAAAGDPNYNSLGRNAYFKRDRFYAEVGMNQVWAAANGVSLESQFRFHKIDDIDTDALSWSKWEYSYRMVAKVPFGVRVWTEHATE
jgi:hypothetical protein